jgi:serine/threonine protein kinase
MVHGELRGDAFHYNKDTGHVQLINFGSGARSFEHGLTSAGWSSLTAQRGVEHKLQFIAPEQTGRLPAEPDSRTDIYSLGILFWTMLTGLPAFAGNTPLEIMQNVLSRRMPTATSIRPDVPDALSAIVQKMAHKSMDDRYNSASGVKHDLQTLKKILTDGDTKALDDFKIASNDVSCFFKLPTHLVGRQQQRDTIINAIEQAAKRFARTQPLSKKGLINLGSGQSFTSSDRLDSMVLDDLLSDSASSGGTKDRESRLNSVSDLTPVSSRQKYSSSNESVPAPRVQSAMQENALAVPPGSRDSSTRI